LLALSFLCALAIVIGAGAVDFKISGPDGKASGNAGLSANDEGPSTGSPDRPAACTESWGQELRVALAAERTLEDWRLHIDAMNRLVAGDITVPQAKALWEASEQGALRRIERFQHLAATLPQAPNACDAATSTDDSGACARAARAVSRTIDTARAAVSTWKVHFTDMDKLRDGEITGRQAEQKWKRLWRTGKAQTVRYDHRATGALAHDCS